ALGRAVLHDPFAGGLRPDLVDAGDVIDLVADQRQVIDDLFRRHAELRLHAGNVELLVGHRVDPERALVDELREVLVAGGDDGAPAACSRLPGQRGGDVGGVDASDPKD